MLLKHGLATLLLSLLVAACSGIETRPSPIADFAAGNYRFYKWRSEPLQNTSNSSDPAYLMDPIMRREVDADLAERGYILDPGRAQFSVDYIYASGLRIGQRSGEVANVTPNNPPATANRQVDQAVIDNSYALSGVKETSNIALQFNDVERNEEVWMVIITEVVENINEVDTAKMHRRLQKGVRQALRTLPEVP